MRSGETVIGIKLVLRLITCVKSSPVSTSKVGGVGLPGEVVSEKGLQSEESLNPMLAGRGVSSWAWDVGGKAAIALAPVVSITVASGRLSEDERYVRTVSRICSNAASSSWKYAKKYESTVEKFSPLSTTLTSIVSLKSRAEDFSMSITAEYGIAIYST